MTIRLFGKGDRVAMPLPLCHKSYFGSEVAYTNPNTDWFLSEHGFAIPLDYNAVPYVLLMRNLVPAPPAHMTKFGVSLNYFLIDENGLLWIVTVMVKENKTEIYHQCVFNDSSGWWLRTSDAEFDSINEFILGFLKSDPTEEQIDNFVFERVNGTRLVWFSVSEIVEKIKNIKRHLLIK